ncbi:MAG: RNA polymerase sigma factor [Christensenellaceae bacterium]|jgi:RNA polymerase sigma factor (sigma-70 family)
MNKQTTKIFTAFETHYDELMRRAVMYMGNVNDAMDLVQELAVVVLEKIEIEYVDKNEIKNERAFLIRCLYYAALNKKRKKEIAVEKDLLHHLIPPELDDEIESMEMVEWAKKELNKHPQEIREAFLRHTLHGFTIKELADELGIQPGALRKRFERIRKVMAKNYLLTLMLLFLLP